MLNIMIILAQRNLSSPYKCDMYTQLKILKCNELVSKQIMLRDTLVSRFRYRIYGTLILKLSHVKIFQIDLCFTVHDNIFTQIESSTSFPQFLAIFNYPTSRLRNRLINLWLHWVQLQWNWPMWSPLFGRIFIPNFLRFYHKWTLFKMSLDFKGQLCFFQHLNPDT